MVDVMDGLGEQHRDMLVVELVYGGTALAHAAHEPEMPQQAQLVGDERLLEPHTHCQRTDGAGPVAQACEQPHAARRRKCLHCLGDRLGSRRIDIGERDSSRCAVTHSPPTRLMNTCSRIAQIALGRDPTTRTTRREDALLALSVAKAAGGDADVVRPKLRKSATRVPYIPITRARSGPAVIAWLQ